MEVWFGVITLNSIRHGSLERYVNVLPDTTLGASGICQPSGDRLSGQGYELALSDERHRVVPTSHGAGVKFGPFCGNGPIPYQSLFRLHHARIPTHVRGNGT